MGTTKVDQLLADPGSRHHISRLTVVEVQSVFAKKVRTGVLSPTEFQKLCRRFRSDIRRHVFEVTRVTSPHFQLAEQLIHRLGPTKSLWSLDALQLAVALDLRTHGKVTQFVSADQRLCTIAAAEGFVVVNPEVP